MAYQILFLKDIPELKSRRGNAITPLLGVILGLNYPVDEFVSAYEWQDASVKTSDDVETVGSLLGSPTVGRWERVDLSQIPQVNADWNSVGGPSQILNKPTPLQGIQGVQGVQGIQGIQGNPGVDAKRIDSYSGTTDATGLLTITYTSAFPVTPAVHVEAPSSSNQVWVKVASTTTGCSFRLVQRNAVTLLSLEVLLAGTVNVVGAAGRITIIAV